MYHYLYIIISLYYIHSPVWLLYIFCTYNTVLKYWLEAWNAKRPGCSLRVLHFWLCPLKELADSELEHHNFSVYVSHQKSPVSSIANCSIPSGKRWHNYGTSTLWICFFTGELTFLWPCSTVFNSKLLVQVTRGSCCPDQWRWDPAGILRLGFRRWCRDQGARWKTLNNLEPDWGKG